MNFPHGLGNWLGINLEGALATVISTALIYALFLLVVRLMGQRMLASLTTFDTLMALLFGGLIARTTLGPHPTLAVGVIAFLTLTLLHFTLGKFANTRIGDRALNTTPRVLMAGEHIVTLNMRYTNTTHRELMAALRSAGIRDYSQVAAVIMEPTGKLSIYHAHGGPISAALLDGVKDAELIPAAFVHGALGRPAQNPSSSAGESR
ncbi:MAG: DUF421 domain-containing protein [Arcanobacterium sp.]|nr:DUF421 domain-containing protein [Arcanobacterium sp.]MDY5589041.1 DUF421 domain-containing protein [Arcanobacterium sp.]